MGKLGAKGPLNSHFARAVRHVTVFLALGSFICLLGTPPRARDADSSRQRSSAFASSEKPGQAQVRAAYANLPLAFEANFGQVRGQEADAVKFLAQGAGYTLFLAASEVVTVANHQPEGLVRMKLLRANPRAQAVGLEELPGRTNYFRGDDPAKWRASVPNYARVEFEGVYPGINLVYYGKQGQLEYDWVVMPGADPAVIRLAFHGAGKLHIDPEGDLVLDTAAGEIRHKKPHIYQESQGGKQSVAGGFVLAGQHEVRFRVADYDKKRRLVIDPVLRYTALFGGSGRPASGPGPAASYFDTGVSIAVDIQGNAYIAGVSYSSDFPTANPLQADRRGFSDIFVVKINASGSAFIYSTYLGGAGAQFNPDEAVGGIAVDSSGNVYVAGSAGPNFPVINAFQPTFAGGIPERCGDAFLAKLNPQGSALLFSTYLGGRDCDQGNGLTLDTAGNAYLTGFTASANFPIAAQAFQTRLGSGPCPGFEFCGDAFVTKFTPAGILMYWTYLGGGHMDSGRGIAVDATGRAYVTGSTYSSDFPTTEGAFQRDLAPAMCSGTDSCSDAFVSKLNPNGTALAYSTYLGGSTWDDGKAIAVDSTGNAFLTGRTRSTDFPTTRGAFQSAKPDPGPNWDDAFVTKINASGSALVYSTFLGGGRLGSTREDSGQAIAVDSSGNACVTGITDSPDFPTVNPIQAANAKCEQATSLCGRDAFVAKLNADGSRLVYSTYLGGTYIPPFGVSNFGEQPGDKGLAIAVDFAGNAFVTGDWRSDAAEFPSAGPLRTVKIGSSVFVVKISETGSPVKPNAVTNAASFVRGAAPGGIVTIFGTGLTRATGIVTAGSVPLPTDIEGTSVTVNGIPAPLFAVAKLDGQEQINLQMPFQLGFRATFVVTNNGIRSDPFYIFLHGPHPGIFSIDSTTAAIQHGADFALVTADNPATKGEVIVIYATGLGPVQPPVEIGKPAPFSPLSRTVSTTVVGVGGVRAEVLFSGLTPGFVGLYQVNARVPEGVASGLVDLSIGADVQSSNAVKLPIR